MKNKMVLMLAGLTLGNLATQAQNQALPNGGFENWQTPTGTFKEPNDWFTLNFLSAFGYDESSLQSVDAHSGASALLLESKGGAFIDIPGLICSNNMFDVNGIADFNKNFVPFHSAPTRLEFYFKSFPALQDTSGGLVLLSKWDSTKNKRDTIALARWRIYDTVSTYTLASVPFNYYSPVTPDSMSIIFSSSIDGYNPVTGTKLYLDDMKLVYAATTAGFIPAKPVVHVFPNPCADKVFINGLEAGCHIQVYDLLGHLLISAEANNEETVLLLSDLKKGTYILHMSSPSVQMNQNHKIIIQ